MDKLDSQILAALESATDLPDHPDDPKLADELISTFNGRHSWLMRWAAVKAVFAVILICFCIYQFFQQQSTMAMIAYASMTVMCAIAYAGIFTAFWVQMNHNMTVREIKRLELQIALLAQKLTQQTGEK